MRMEVKILVIAIACGTAAMLAAQQPSTDSAVSVAAGEGLFFGKAGCAGGAITHTFQAKNFGRG